MMLCPKCGSDKMMPNVRIVYRDRYGVSGDVDLEIYKDPEAMLFKGAVGDPLRRQVCGERGFTELYANDPGALWETYTKGGEVGSS